MHAQITIKEVKQGDLIRFNVDGTVYIRGEYDRTQKKYELTRWDDCSRAIYRKGTTNCLIGFTF